MSEDTEALINNIIKTDPEFFRSAESIRTKERMVKEGLLKAMRDIVTSLDQAFHDVNFFYQWGYQTFKATELNHPIVLDQYNEDFHSEMDCYGSMYETIDEKLDCLEATPLASLSVKLMYFWERNCSLGCQHRTKRFRIISLPTLMDMIALHRLKAPASTLVKQYLPDFFYDSESASQTLR